MGATSHRDEVFLKKVSDAIDSHIDDEAFGVEELCREIGVSRSKLHRKLSSLTGKSSSQFIREFRLDRALVLLRQDVGTSAEVAYSVGFKSPSYFSTSFHAYFGYPPSEVKNRDPDAMGYQENKDSKKHFEPNRIKNSYRLKKVILIGFLLSLSILAIRYSLRNTDELQAQGDSIATETAEKTIAVLPFAVLSDERSDEFFSDGLIASIQNNLSKIQGLTVISERSLQRYKEKEVSPSMISKELDIDFLLTGTIAKQNDSVRVIVNLLNAPKEALISSMVFERDYAHILSIQTDIGMEISRGLNISLSPYELNSVRQIPTDNIDAYNLYLKGAAMSSTYLISSQEMAIEYFRKSIGMDPEFALPYAGMAECYRILALNNKDNLDREIRKIKSLARKSIELEENSLAHVVLGALAVTQECNWEDGEREYRRAIEVNPNDPDAHLYLADFLLHVKKSYDESLVQLERAQLLDPFNVNHKLFLSKFYFFQRDYEKAMIEFQNAGRINEFVTKTSELGFFVLVKQEEHDRAMQELEKLMRHNEEFSKMADDLTPVFKKEGMEGVFRFLIKNRVYFESLVSNEQMSFAGYHAYLGENSEAIDNLRLAIDSKSHCLYVIPTNPYFDDLHTDPEFIVLMQRLGLDGILDTELPG